jgi:hypothetical protein
MLKSINLIFIFTFLFAAPTFAQVKGRIAFKDIVVESKGNQGSGANVDYPFIMGQTTNSYTLFYSDSLTVTARYKMTANNNRRSQIKDSSVRFNIQYEITYRGFSSEKKTEKMYFLDDSRSFKEKEVFNLNTSKFSNTQIRISYTGTVSE